MLWVIAIKLQFHQVLRILKDGQQIPQISGVFSESISIGTSSEKVEPMHIGTGVTVPEQFDVLSDVIECIWELMACNRGHFLQGEWEVDLVEVRGSFCRVLDMLEWLI